MPRNRSSRRTARRRSSTTSVVTTQSLGQRFLMKCARSDAAPVMVHWVSNTTVAANTIYTQTFSPGTSTSTQLVTMTGYYSRYRIKEIIVKIGNNSTTALTACGILDDFGGTNGTPVPSSFNAIASLRCSNTDLGATDDSESQFVWRPLDPKRWFYTIPGLDIRDNTPATVYFVSTSSGVQYIEFFATYVFSGRTGQGTSDVTVDDPWNRILPIRSMQSAFLPSEPPSEEDEPDEPIHVSHPRGLRVPPDTKPRLSK
jgi:hypothetical protein